MKLCPINCGLQHLITFIIILSIVSVVWFHILYQKGQTTEDLYWLVMISVPDSIEKLRVIFAVFAVIQGSFCEIQGSSMNITEIDQPQSFEFTKYSFSTCILVQKKRIHCGYLKKKSSVVQFAQLSFSEFYRMDVEALHWLALSNDFSLMLTVTFVS